MLHKTCCLVQNWFCKSAEDHTVHAVRETLMSLVATWWASSSTTASFVCVGQGTVSKPRHSILRRSLTRHFATTTSIPDSLWDAVQPKCCRTVKGCTAHNSCTDKLRHVCCELRRRIQLYANFHASPSWRLTPNIYVICVLNSAATVASHHEFTSGTEIWENKKTWRRQICWCVLLCSW